MWTHGQWAWLGLVAVAGLVHCTPVHRSAAVLAAFQRLHPCPATGRTVGPCPGYIKDHIVPLCLIGAAGDRVDNLQWQTVADAKKKDVLERQQCRIAGCAHRGD